MRRGQHHDIQHLQPVIARQAASAPAASCSRRRWYPPAEPFPRDAGTGSPGPARSGRRPAQERAAPDRQPYGQAIARRQRAYDSRSCGRLTGTHAADSLLHRHLHQGVLGTRLRDGAAVAIHAAVVADPQRDRTQAQRLLALHHALAAAVALLFVDDVFVEIVGRIFGIHFADGLAR